MEVAKSNITLGFIHLNNIKQACKFGPPFHNLITSILKHNTIRIIQVVLLLIGEILSVSSNISKCSSIVGIQSRIEKGVVVTRKQQNNQSLTKNIQSKYDYCVQRKVKL
jgi:hypothetical protein